MEKSNFGKIRNAVKELAHQDAREEGINTPDREHYKVALKLFRKLKAEKPDALPPMIEALSRIRELRTNMNKKIKDKIKMKIIAENGSLIGKDQSKTTLTEVKFIENPRTSPAVINIYGDITLIALWLKNPIAFYINSKEVSTSFKNNFDLIWKNAK